jgi:hypothetical protein
MDGGLPAASPNRRPESGERRRSFEAKVDVPNPCFNPAVFVSTGAGDPPRWFAVTGR